MLFDLRSRGRRRTVQVVYLGLAVLFGLGLVLFGVGTGSGGGLLNAFTGNGSSNQGSVISQQEKTALRETKANPNNPGAWADLINARWQTANANSQLTTAGTQFTAKGKQELTGHHPGLAEVPEPDQAAPTRTWRSWPPAPTPSSASTATPPTPGRPRPRPAPPRPRATSAWRSPPTPPSRPARATSPRPRP